ncbi:MAG: hypothetical protein E7406_08070 [Ruminococcaceae bacterium]|nr:hypothetical protein [Oscillospiraceae bacterium]
MRILDEDRNKALNNITLLLTKEEAMQILSDLDDLVNGDTKGDHYHINNNDFSKEITVALYDENKIDDFFSKRYEKLIKYDK